MQLIDITKSVGTQSTIKTGMTVMVLHTQDGLPDGWCKEMLEHREQYGTVINVLPRTQLSINVEFEFNYSSLDGRRQWWYNPDELSIIE